MTTWYFDSVNGSDSNAGTSATLAKKNYDAFSFAGANPGDTYLFKRGTTQIIVTANKDARPGSSNDVRTRYGAYGEAQVRYSIWKNPSNAGNMILNVSGRSNIIFEDMYFDGSGVNLFSLYLPAAAATPTNNHRIARCHFTNMGGGASGLVIGSTNTSIGDTTNYSVEDCYLFNNPVHGMLVNGAHGVAVRRSHFYGNGFNAAAGGQGFSAKFRQTIAASGWTASGLVWNRALASYETDVYYVKTNVTGYKRLNRTAGTQTLPAAGEFGVSAGILYINVNSGSNPSSQGIVYAWGRCYDITVEDCESYGNVWYVSAPTHEGHGFAFDDYTELSIFRRNKSYNNQGAGFSVNRGDNNILESNIAYGNWLSGLSAAACYGTTVRHNTFLNNNAGTGAYNGEIVFFPDAKNGVLKNNILKGSTSYGLDLDVSCTGFSGDKNVVSGYTSVERGSTLTNTLTDDPQLDTLYRPKLAVVKRAGIYLGGKDFYGKNFYKTPNIGAVDDHPAPGWAASALLRP